MTLLPTTIWSHTKCAVDKVEAETSIKAAQIVSVQQVVLVSSQATQRISKGSLLPKFAVDNILWVSSQFWVAFSPFPADGKHQRAALRVSMVTGN